MKNKFHIVFVVFLMILTSIGMNRLYQSQRVIPVSQGINMITQDDGIDPASINEFMTFNMRRTGIPGVAIGIVKNGQVIYTAGYGKDSNNDPISSDTKMYIGSISKSFTALAVMQLVEQGKIQLEQSVKTYLTDFTTQDKRSDKITVKELLNQTSGLADRGFPEMSLPQPLSLGGEMQRLSRAHLVADPGTMWNYHNPNYHILAALVERVSGLPFNIYMDKHVFGPLGAENTTSVTFAGEYKEIADGYMFVYGIPVSLNALPHFVMGSGGVISTANDMAKWVALQVNRGISTDGTLIISPASLEEMHTTSGTDNQDYAFGWEQDMLPDGLKRIEHGGTLFTYSSNAAFYPETGYGFVILFNSASAIGAEQQSFIDGLYAILKHETPKLGVQVNLISDSILGFLTVLTILFCIRGVRGVKTWNERKSNQSLLIKIVRNLPYVFFILTGVFILKLFGFMFGGRDITWLTGMYGWSAILIFFETLAVASAVLFIARLLIRHSN